MRGGYSKKQVRPTCICCIKHWTKIKITDDMEYVLNALCVRTVDYKDYDRLITLCTIEKGKILVRARGCLKPKAKLKYATSPLCFGEYIVIETNGRYILKGCECYESFANLTADIEKYYVGFGVLECLDKLSKEAEVETTRNLTLLAIHTLKDLSFSNLLTESILIKFIKNLLEILGYKLNFDTCAVSGKLLKNKRICYDYSYSGIVLFEHRSINYIELNDNIISVLNEEKNTDEKTAVKIAKILVEILQTTTNIKNIYSFHQFFEFKI